jgi:hypothetical protein
MSPPKVVEILNGFGGTVTVCTEADGTTHSWTVTADDILGGGFIDIEGTETLDYNTYRREGGRWQSYTPGGTLESVSDKIAAQLDLIEQAAAAHKSTGSVQ